MTVETFMFGICFCIYLYIYIERAKIVQDRTKTDTSVASRFHAAQVTGSGPRERSERPLRVSLASLASSGAKRSLGRGVRGETRSGRLGAVGSAERQGRPKSVVFL